jgi:hypothetical protein
LTEFGVIKRKKQNVKKRGRDFSLERHARVQATISLPSQSPMSSLPLSLSFNLFFFLADSLARLSSPSSGHETVFFTSYSRIRTNPDFFFPPIQLIRAPYSTPNSLFISPHRPSFYFSTKSKPSHRIELDWISPEYLNRSLT